MINYNETDDLKCEICGEIMTSALCYGAMAENVVQVCKQHTIECCDMTLNQVRELIIKANNAKKQ